MRDRDRILNNLESAYREAYGSAEARGSEREMERLDFEFQRDQLFFELLLDLRDLLSVAPDDGAEPGGETALGLLEKAQAVRRLVRFR